ncbi:hypothetical protein EDE12_11147 [Methylosinus sp. sav-2]|uniref:SGNH/GDSL hydrolase family protein n=1 Tax=Methylosinus sp. sav-2 TaxID=2485168 RepID=UPI001066E8EF|nr:SGNH/GDSL hydrolase family protein [Methylosinus sp. sav-2]TDX62141.1 hypothetical protein EDE12_11147 [Methylosinus sp. sav-2]
MKLRRILKVTATLALLMLVGAEVTIRLSGLVDFPLYIVDQQIGYMPAPSQRGAFLVRNSWEFNDRSMGTKDGWNPDSKINVLIAGNSIVMGGNSYKHYDKLGPQLEARLGEKFAVWPVASGGWTNVNESVFLERNIDVLERADIFVWEYMSGGLSAKSQWKNDYIWPRTRPVCATCYVVYKYVVPAVFGEMASELPPTGEVQQRYLDGFVKTIDSFYERKANVGGHNIKIGILFLYPTKNEVGLHKNNGWLPERHLIESVANERGMHVIDLASYDAWSADMYRDGVHPTIRGNKIISEFIYQEIATIMHSNSLQGGVGK